MSMKSMVGKKMNQKVKFMGEEVSISKLSVAEVLEIQELSKNASDDSGMGILRMVLRSAVEDAKELTDEEFASFPMDELTKLSQAIMKFSGIDTGSEKGK